MRSIICIALPLLFVPLFLQAQTTFNKRFHFDFLAATATSVLPVDDGFIVTGIIADTLHPYNTGGFFAKLDAGGNLVLLKTLTDTQRTFETWYNSLTLLPDSSFLLTGTTYYGSGENTLILKLDAEGDTLFTKEFANPFYPQFDRIQPRGGMVVLDNGELAVSNWITKGPDHHPNADIYIFKLDAFGNMIWDRHFPFPNWERASSTVKDMDDNIIFGWLTDNTTKVQSNFTSQIRLVKTNPDGEILWEYTSPVSLGLLDLPNDMVLLEDGSLVIATGTGTEIERFTGNTIWFEKRLMKLTPNLEVAWALDFWDPEFDGLSRLTNLESVSDGSGFVVAGEHGEDINGLYNYAIKGDISKVSPNGQTLWTRRYLGIEGTAPRHEVFDLKECPDGGFILAGKSLDGSFETIPPQQAWLLKLDRHGCLIPGCHQTTDAGEAEQAGASLAIYPNPTSDYLNFQLRNFPAQTSGTFRILDAAGRTVHTTDVPYLLASDTFILPVWDWAPGVYVLQYVAEGEGVVVSEKFVKL